MPDPTRDGARDSEGSNSTPNVTEKKKSRRPANTAFRQQRLKAWQPIVTPKSVLPILLVIGIIFAPIGGLILYADSLIKDLEINYTGCGSEAQSNYTDMPQGRVKMYFRNGTLADIHPQWKVTKDADITLARNVTTKGDICYLRFNILDDIQPPVLFYYYLTQFHQNHRRYVDSFDQRQLNGEALSAGDVSNSKCTPLTVDSRTNKPIFPCGLIANSMFNDTFTSPVLVNPPGSNARAQVYEMNNNTYIAWPSDKELYNATRYTYDQVVPPPNWHKRYPNGYTADDGPPNLETWEAFQVWMRTAALPNFSKLYQRNDNDVMKAGTYEVRINDFFPVTEYGGTKSMFITTRTVLGARIPSLGIAYLVVSGLCITFAAIFAVTHLIKPRKLGDHTYLSWNKVPAAKSGRAMADSTTGVASGRDLRTGEA